MAKKMMAIVMAAAMSVTLLAGCAGKGADTPAAADNAGRTTETREARQLAGRKHPGRTAADWFRSPSAGRRIR